MRCLISITNGGGWTYRCSQGSIGVGSRLQSMAATIRFYQQRDRTALAAWNGGEGRNSGGCAHKVGVPTNEMPPLTPATLENHTLARNIHAAARPWKWGTSHQEVLQGPVWFLGNGTLNSPWGDGSWGAVPGPWRKEYCCAFKLDSLPWFCVPAHARHFRPMARFGSALHVKLRNATYLLMFLSEKWAFVAVRCSDEQVTYGRLDAATIPEKRLVW